MSPLGETLPSTPPKPSLATMWGCGTNGDMQGIPVVAGDLQLT